jgi:hypothetical protein
MTVTAAAPEDAMLDAFIIEEIKRREQERRERRPRLELPLPEPSPRRQDNRREPRDPRDPKDRGRDPDQDDPREGPREAPSTPQRGVLIIDYSEPPVSPG